MWWLLSLIPGVPLSIYLVTAVIRYIVWCRKQKKCVLMEDRRSHLLSVNYRANVGGFARWFDSRLFERRYNRALRNIKRRKQ